MITIVFGSESDGHLRSSSSSYSSALSGSNLTVFDTGTGIRVGQVFDGSTYYIRQGFLEFVHGAPNDADTVAGQFVLQGSDVTGSGVERQLYLYEYDWGSSIDSSDWNTRSDILTYGQSNGFLNRSEHGRNRSMFFYYRQHVADLNTSGTLRYLVVSDRNRNERTPTSAEDQTFHSARSSGTSNDPKLEVSSVSEHLLNKTLAGQVQLSDGTHVYLEQENVSGEPFTINLKHRDSDDNITSIDSFEEDDQRVRGSHCYALVADDDDNLYVFRNLIQNTNFIYSRSYIKGPTHTWSQGDQISLPIVEDAQNTFCVSMAGTYHDVGSGGTIFLMGVKDGGRAVGGNTDPWLLLNSQRLLGLGSGDIVRATGRAGDEKLIAWPATAGYLNFINPTGSLLDVASLSSSRNGFIICAERHQLLGSNGSQSITRYRINSNGDGFEQVNSTLDTQSGLAVKDPEARSRVFALANREDQFVTITASSEFGEGLTVEHRQISLEVGRFYSWSTTYLDDESITSMPAAETVATSSAWDAVYNDVDHSVWIYYFDDNDERRLMRTQIDLNEGNAVANEVEAATGVGEADSTNYAVRVNRGQQSKNDFLITVSNRTAETSGGDHSLIYITDTINVVPTQPTLVAEANFDADLATRFEWTFNDADPDDSQSAYRLQIDNASDGTSAYDTGKTVSSDEFHDLTGGSIANDVDYRWRVRTWDTEDEPSPWSNYDTFTTSNTGVVNIIDPSVDNESGIHVANYEIEWTVTEATPDHYKVVVTRTDNDDVLVDTGWVASTDTTYEIVGLITDVEYLIEVTTKQSEVESNTATRLITSDYDTPEIPIASYDINNTDGYIRISVNNPTPKGDRPNPDVNDIYRRVENSGTAYELVGVIDPNSSFRDYTAAAGVVYEYRVRAGVKSE